MWLRRLLRGCDIVSMQRSFSFFFNRAFGSDAAKETDNNESGNDTREELDFMLDEEMEELNVHKRSFTKWDSDSDDDVTDADIRKIIIVTQVLHEILSLKHPLVF